ncbi:hypothetical protein FBQ82_19300 [Anaerolineae bacterium CFX7]|nr:hypothetical protein [Anaerolineae bacterium CFX7]
MSTMADYTQDEIEKLMVAPMLVSMYVMGASVSGPIGLVKEMMAGVETAVKIGKASEPGSLFNGLFSEENMKAQQDKMQQGTKESTQGAQNMDEAKAKMRADLQAAVGIVAAKGSPEELAAYKQMMLQAAENVANAAKEGGFMGIGGVVVNDAEKQAITEISAALDNPTMPSAEPPAAENAAPAEPAAKDDAAPAA